MKEGTEYDDRLYQLAAARVLGYTSRKVRYLHFFWESRRVDDIGVHIVVCLN
jgi:hypothetical protein